MFKDKTLLIAVLIPTLMIFLTILSVVLPRFFFNPKNDFIIQTGDGYVEKEFYIIEDGKLQINKSRQRLSKPFSNFGSDLNQVNDDPQMILEMIMVEEAKNLKENVLYYYDVSEGKAKKISLEEAQKFNLSDETVLDGYYVSTSGSDYTPYFLMGRSGNFRTTLNNKYFSKVLEIMPLTRGYQTSYFVGWVVK